MSGLAAILNLDGRPAEREPLAEMLACIADRGPDGRGIALDGPAGIGHALFRTSHDSHDSEVQPLWDEAREVCLAFAGRLDNKDEMAAHLDGRNVRLRTASDAETILKSYLQRGHTFLSSLLGDFAFVIWDRRRHVLLCARDPLGVAPLYYRSSGKDFCCGSSLRQVLPASVSGDDLNEGMIGEYLACAVRSQEETLYRNVFRLPPAHVIEVSSGRMRMWRYWNIDPGREIRYGEEGDYAEHLRDLLREAVRCRLRSTAPVGVMLSGGLDSSSVTCVAEALRREERPGHPALETFSQTYPGLGCDESPWIRTVVDGRDLVSHLLPAQQQGSTWYAEQARTHLDFPGYPDDGSTLALLGAAKEQGIRVVLTGYGGDEWFSGSRWHYADLLRKLRLGDLLRRAGSDEALAAVPGSRRSAIIKYGLWPLAPVKLREAARAMMGRSAVPAWVDSAFARRIDLEGRIRHEIVRGPFRSFARAELQATLEDGGLSHGLEMEDRLAARAGVEQRHPFHDRRVVEFAFAIPEEQRCRPGMHKWILRRAMEPILPPDLLRRPGKAEFSDVFAGALHEVGGAEAFAGLAAAGRGWIDGIVVKRMFDELNRLRAMKAPEAGSCWPLWMIHGIDLWLRTATAEAPASIPVGREPVLTGALRG